MARGWVWVARHSEWGSGYFAPVKPASVRDAELRFNVVEWGNGLTFASTFRLTQGVTCWVGPIRHEPDDLSTPALQVFLESSFATKIERVCCEALMQDVVVGPRGRANTAPRTRLVQPLAGVTPGLVDREPPNRPRAQEPFRTRADRH